MIQLDPNDYHSVTAMLRKYRAETTSPKSEIQSTRKSSRLDWEMVALLAFVFFNFGALVLFFWVIYAKFHLG